MKGKVLVTGGGGFIGSFLCEQLLQKGYDVRAFDNLDPQVHPARRRPRYLTRECEFVQGDVRDPERLGRALSRVHAVVHLAARVGVGQSQYEIRSYTDVNIGGTANLLDLVANRHRARIRKLVVASSMSIYGEGAYECPSCGPRLRAERTGEQLKSRKWEPLCTDCTRPLVARPTQENHPLRGDSIYAITKRVQEEMVISVGRTYGIPSAAMRFFNVYGPRQSLSNPYTGVLSLFLSRTKNRRPPIIYEDGLQTRDFISVHDVARACVALIESGEAVRGVFNLGSGRGRAIRDIALKLIRETHSGVKPRITERYRQGDIRHCTADISRIRKALGFEPLVSFEDGIRELLDWAREEKARDYSHRAQRELLSRGLV
ncbi:MAG: SDR family NAD(P)-dependent oxidoreductase [Candidatus Omnitrophica bacterium]|nr:SDR family NAD(P)-dependent oxidoreductase [Candidatus Omnitrophota bacterium]